jgi:hypothetical protein
MGHIRLKRLPATRQWRQVVSLLAGGASLSEIAKASAEAAQHALELARDDPVLAQSVWLMTQLPLAARSPDFDQAAAAIGLNLPARPSLLDVIAAFNDAVEHATSGAAGRTDLGEMARRAAAESLAAVAGAELPGLFDPTEDDVRLALGQLAAPDRFAKLVRDFFSRLTFRHLDYYLSRTLPSEVGPSRRLGTISDRVAFDAALNLHCQEASRIVEEFAGGWFSKTNYRGGITPRKAGAFAFVSLGKISSELRKREAQGV